MPYKIGVFGSSAGKIPTLVIDKAREIGKELGKNSMDIITGACPGLPYEAAFEAHKYGAAIRGYSPEVNLTGQRNFAPNDDLTIYKKIFYIPRNFPFLSNPYVCKKYRNVISTANCNAGIIISGRWGTMNEFTNLYDMGKVIGILTKTGGIADELAKLNQKIKKKSKAIIHFSNSPKKLVKSIINSLKEKGET